MYVHCLDDYLVILSEVSCKHCSIIHLFLTIAVELLEIHNKVNEMLALFTSEEYLLEAKFVTVLGNSTLFYFLLRIQTQTRGHLYTRMGFTEICLCIFFKLRKCTDAAERLVYIVLTVTDWD